MKLEAGGQAGNSLEELKSWEAERGKGGLAAQAVAFILLFFGFGAVKLLESVELFMGVGGEVGRTMLEKNREGESRSKEESEPKQGTDKAHKMREIKRAMAWSAIAFPSEKEGRGKWLGENGLAAVADRGDAARL